MRLRPDDHISERQLVAGRRSLVLDSAFASLTGALSGGVILVAFALALGAGPVVIGLLAAIPFIAQAAQLPAIALVERLRQRRLIGVLAVTTARVIILAMALIPFAPAAVRLPLLIASQVAISALGSVGACAINSWLHQLISREALGAFFSKRLFWGTALAAIGTIAAGAIVDHPWRGNRLDAFAFTFIGAGLAGFASSWFLARAPEPKMAEGGLRMPITTRLRAPLHDANFRHVLVFLGAWTVASNVAAPFLTVYLLSQLGYALATVTSLWVTSQVANALTLYLWGRLSDRLSNKAVLAVALPVYFACTLGLVFTDIRDHETLKLALLYAFHIVMGAASGGIGLATGNLGLKLAPQGQGTAYLAAIGLVSAFAGGIAPIAAGAVAEWFSTRELSVVLRWVSPVQVGEVAVFAFAHWEFLFAISALLGLYVMHALSRISEGDEISERQVVQEFGLEALRSLNQLSSIGGILGTLFPFDRVLERRRTTRSRARG
jgi:MFS family permease